MSKTPALARHTLAQMMRRLRRASGVTLDAAAAEIGCDPTTVGRWEKAKSSPRRSDLMMLARLYNASSAEIGRMTGLLMQAGQQGIWESAKLSPELRTLYEAEMSATSIDVVELDLIPALAQTMEYLRAVQAVELPPVSPSATPEMVERTWRQRHELVFTDPVPTIRLVLGQSSLSYLDDLPEVQSGQLNRLQELDALPSVEVRVLTRLHASMIGGFTIIDPIDSPEGVGVPFVFIEAADGCRYVEDSDVVSRHRAIFEMVWTRAQPIEEYLK